MKAVVTLLTCLSLGAAVLAAEADKPHPHQGVLPPYPPVSLAIELDEDQREDLAKGDLVIFTLEQSDTGGRGVAVLDINAPIDTVWSRIMGFDHFTEWVGPVKISEVYRQEGQDIYTHMKVSGFLYKYEYYLRNTWWPDEQMMTWVMDYDRYSDFDDCTGAWYVEPHPTKENWSRAWFSSDLKLRAKIPGFLMKFIKKQGLKDATSWVQEQSEIAAGTVPPEEEDYPYDY